MNNSVFSGIPDKDDMERHYAAMRGGDDQLSYTETGDFVIPPEVQQANPALMMAAMQMMREMGANPDQYISGSEEGSYNPVTGVQEFGWFEDLQNSEFMKNASKFTQKTANYISNHDFAKAAATGALTAGVSKLAGQGTQASLAAGAGAGLGYYAGNTYSRGLGNLKNEESFFAEAEPTNYTSNTVMESLGNLAKSTNLGALSGAALGGDNGLMMPRPIPDYPDLQLKSPAASQLSPMAEQNPFGAFADNERANLSATIPQNLPVGPMTPRALQGAGGVSYKKKVKDRDTGRTSYVDDDSNDASAFSRALNKRSRRKGFGGGLIYI